MKKLYLIGGAMGVGKTTICQALKRTIKNSVFLDGDWCWDANPFLVTEETKRMVLDNICHVLNNFIGCSAYQAVIFGWVMHEQSIIDQILSRLDIKNCRVYKLSLVCEIDVLLKRLQKDIESGLRKPDVIARSMQKMALYETLDTVKIDVSHGLPEEIAKGIAAL